MSNKKIAWALVLGCFLILILFWISSDSKFKRASVVKLPIFAPEKTETKIVQDGLYKISSEESVLVWEGKKTLIKDDFKSGTILVKDGFFNVKDNELLDGEIVIDMTTIKSETIGLNDGKDLLSEHLLSDDFFDVANFPETKFVTSDYTEGVLKGMLTIKDVTKPISFKASADMLDDGKIVINGVALVDRTIWGITYGSGSFFENLGDNLINDIFSLEFNIVAELEN